jgi:hypothetical protein
MSNGEKGEGMEFTTVDAGGAPIGVEVIWRDCPGLAEAEREYEEYCAALVARLNKDLQGSRYLSERHQLEMRHTAKLAFINDPERNIRFQIMAKLMNYRTIDRVVVMKERA